MSKHTPGPWLVAPDPGQACPECGGVLAENLMVGHRTHQGVVKGVAVVLSDDCERSNAALIAAAPDLLAACIASLELLPKGEYPGHGAGSSAAVKVRDQVRAAIAKGKGGAR